jgi:hypothetical protein
MEDKILDADHVLMVCTEQYLKKIYQVYLVPPDEEQGVCREASLIYARLYEMKLNTTKFLPVLFSPEDEEFIPRSLQDKRPFVIDAQSGYERLYAFLTRRARPIFPRSGSALKTVAQETIEPLFAMPNPQLGPKPATLHAPRRHIRRLEPLSMA